MPTKTLPQAIVLFDGMCNLCSGVVQFIIARDPKAYFHFASLQSDKGQQLLLQHHIKLDTDAIVFIENNKAYIASTAVLRICKHLNGGYRFMAIGLIIPAFIRDSLYRYIARNRYQWWGKHTSCWLPSADLQSRFL
jgi:predicted DCC family thiol-disulfide oxidoreductase YuxK